MTLTTKTPMITLTGHSPSGGYVISWHGYTYGGEEAPHTLNSAISVHTDEEQYDDEKVVPWEEYKRWRDGKNSIR